MAASAGLIIASLIILSMFAAFVVGLGQIETVSGATMITAAVGVAALGGFSSIAFFAYQTDIAFVDNIWSVLVAVMGLGLGAYISSKVMT